MSNEVRTEDLAEYNASETPEDAIIEQALRIIERRARATDGTPMTSPKAVYAYFRLRLGELEHEAFSVAFLDAQNRLICTEEIFRGTLTQTSVYPREVVKLALQHNAAAIICAHNHPSGNVEPSNADTRLTEVLKRTLALVDVKVLDHVIVSPFAAMSFAERGLL